MIDPLEVHLQQIRDALRTILVAHRSHIGYTAWPADIERVLEGPLPAAEADAKRLLRNTNPPDAWP